VANNLHGFLRADEGLVAAVVLDNEDAHGEEGVDKRTKLEIMRDIAKLEQMYIETQKVNIETGTNPIVEMLQRIADESKPETTKST
jgi:hypothetical protein